MENSIDIEVLKKLIEAFHKLSLTDQAYIIGYITHMAQEKLDSEKKVG